LTEFKESEGHCNVRKGFQLRGFELAVWVVRQRFVKDQMSNERKERLDALGFVWDSRAAKWDEGFSKLLQFKEAEGHYEVPYRFKIDDFTLGRWVLTQRTNKDSMLSERKKRLDDIGFIWDVSKDKT
jgi:hypothetical protein